MNRDQPEDRLLETSSKWFERAVAWAEDGIAFVLAVVIVGATVSLIFTVGKLGLGFPYEADAILKVVKSVLDIFILIELFRITIAYVQHGDVIPTVLETALVVAAREVVVVEAGKDNPVGGAAVAFTLVAIGIAWYLLRKAQAVGRHDRIDLRLPEPKKDATPAMTEESE
jgi:uncharacterized membrane protein (DUF373 family)